MENSSLSSYYYGDSDETGKKVRKKKRWGRRHSKSGGTTDTAREATSRLSPWMPWGKQKSEGDSPPMT